MRGRALALSLGLLASGLVHGGEVELAEKDAKYFSNANQEHSHVKVKAKPAYGELGTAEQDSAVNGLMRRLDKDLKGLEGPLLLSVDQGSRGSLWIYPERARQPYKFEEWEKEGRMLDARSPLGRWFGYVGLGASLGFPKEFDGLSFGANLAVRIGSLLYKDILDLGVSAQAGYNGGLSVYASDSATTTGVGVFSRVHFPLFSTLRGNVGGEAAYSDMNSSSQTTDIGTSKAGSTSSSRSTNAWRSETAALAGLSLYLPFGSLDLDARFAVVNTYSLGITAFFSAGSGSVEDPPSSDAPAKKKPSRRSTFRDR